LQQLRILENATLDPTVAAALADNIQNTKVLNLTGIALSPAALSLLQKGYNFVPRPRKLTLQNRTILLGKTKAFVRNLTWHLHTANGTHTPTCNRPVQARPPQPVLQLSLSASIAAVQRSNPTDIPFTAPTNISMEAQLTGLALQNKLLSLIPNATAHLRSNLTTLELQALANLQKQCRTGDLVIRKADKSRQLVLLTRPQYNAAMEILLSDQNNYEVIPFNKQKHTVALLRQVKKIHQQMPHPSTGLLPNGKMAFLPFDQSAPMSAPKLQ
jgi:hypothetical protein